MTKLVTVTIPSYRQENLLRRTLSSLRDQTFKNFNVVILDDQSGVDFKTEFAPFFEELSITVLTHPNNIGAMKNLLASITYNTDAKYILSLHEDDYLTTNYLEYAIKALEENDDAAFATTSPLWISYRDMYTRKNMKNDTYHVYERQGFMKAVLKGVPFIFGAVIYRKKDITIEGYDTDKYHTFCDRVFLSNLLRNNKVAVYLEQPGILVQDHNLDETNPRPKGITLEHLVRYYSFYKSELTCSDNEKRKLLSNVFLLSCAYIPKKVSLREVFEVQKNVHLIDLRYLDKKGIYALVRLVVNKKLFHMFVRIASFIKTKKALFN